MRPMEEQTILITGATGGLGQELARALAEQGATLLLHGRDAERGAGSRWQTMSSVEEGLEASLRLVVDPTLEECDRRIFRWASPS
jgi:NAD(P)-dependent dehydrogenase (short-subunit alcohol dehydrogenase family)